jgi:hypothetical protein
MRILTIVGLIVAGSLLAGCQSNSGNDAMSDLSSSMSGGLGRDTYGTNRRMDVYGGATAPSLPTIGAPGYGK